MVEHLMHACQSISTCHNARIMEAVRLVVVLLCELLMKIRSIAT
jgi:hypothetical protein